jgi:hypothetical protein
MDKEAAATRGEAVTKTNSESTGGKRSERGNRYVNEGARATIATEDGYGVLKYLGRRRSGTASDP